MDYYDSQSKQQNRLGNRKSEAFIDQLHKKYSTTTGFNPISKAKNRYNSINELHRLQADQEGLPLPSVEFLNQKFVLSYFDIYDQVMQDQCEKVLKRRQKKTWMQESPDKRFKEIWSSVKKDDESLQKEDVVSNFLKLYNGMGLFDRESIQKELLRGRFKVNFPQTFTDVDAKLYKLASDPVFYQLYKRGDLIQKIKSEKPKWSDLFTRRYLNSVLSEEQALKLKNQLDLAVSTQQQTFGLGRQNSSLQSYFEKQKGLRVLQSQVQSLSEEYETLRLYALQLRMPGVNLIRKMINEGQFGGTKEGMQKAEAIEQRFVQIQIEQDKMTRSELIAQLNHLIRENLNLIRIDSKIERLKKLDDLPEFHDQSMFSVQVKQDSFEGSFKKKKKSFQSDNQARQLSKDLIKIKHDNNRTLTQLKIAQQRERLIQRNQSLQSSLQAIPQKKREIIKIVSKERQMLNTLEATCETASDPIMDQIQSITEECKQIRERMAVFDYCAQTLADLKTVDKNYLPQLFELKHLADAEEKHDLKKTVRTFKKSKKFDPSKVQQIKGQLY